MTLYVDIDGTLTDSSTRGGRPIEERVRREIERGRDDGVRTARDGRGRRRNFLWTVWSRRTEPTES